MIDPTPLTGVGAAAALAAGFSGSLHCAVMCGPLASAPGSAARAHGSAFSQTPAGIPARIQARFGWHLGRFVAYGAVGAGLGVAGRGLAFGLARYVQPVLPWLMVLGLVASAFEFGRRLPAGGLVGGLSMRLLRLGERASPLTRAALLGAVTPFLPCGLLWGIFLVAVGAGSALGGVAVMTAFALGSTPGLAAVQVGAGWSGRWPRAESVLKRAIPLTAAGVVALRALASGDPGDPGDLIAPGGHGGHGMMH